MRLIFCIALAIAGIIIATTFEEASGADEPPNYDFSTRKSGPRPSEILGWALVRVCSVTGKLDHRFSEYAYIRPSYIVAIGNPPTSPDPCVALHSSVGRRIFVEGTMEGMARYLADLAEDSNL
jgi:hypothetical protein